MKNTLFVLVTLLLVTSCIKPSIDPTNWEDKEYNEIPSTVFERLSPALQYKIKYKYDSDSILTFEYSKRDTIYLEDGTMNRVTNVSDTFYLYLKKDSIIYRPVYDSKPYLHFSTLDKYYDKTRKRFTDSFSFDFKYSKKDKYYYILKEDFPTLDTTTYLKMCLINPAFFNKPTGNVDSDLEMANFNYCFILRDTHKISAGSLGKINGKPNPEHDIFVLEENKETKLLKWLTGSSKAKNVYTDD